MSEDLSYDNTNEEQTADADAAFLDEMNNSFAAAGTLAGTTTATDGPSSYASETMATSSAIPDVMLLNILCARAKPPKESEESRLEAQMSWQPVREWLAQHDAETVRTAAEQRGESGLTALHFACRNVPPLDVVDVFLSIAADTVQWPDSFGWLRECS